MQAGNQGAGDVKSDINVTPLVDVCLVLLIIFMVVTPMLQKGVNITLPAAAAAEKKPDSANTLTVAITKDNRLYIEKDPVSKELLLSAMQEIHDRSPEKIVYVKADKFLKYGDVKEVMMTINEAGFERVGLLTEPKSESETKAVKH
ncbi:MAG TPA: biopolymer transporter ExbD [Candidatus Polarisedimenticolia bacterium]|nr:biopolymer transporter ExbD [Candidatus Polarisedimenticolia bacterium]